MTGGARERDRLISQIVGGGEGGVLEIGRLGPSELEAGDLPPCVGERVSFMMPFELRRTMTHPYTEIYPETHGHFAPTRFVQPPYSAACVPFASQESIRASE